MGQWLHGLIIYLFLTLWFFWHCPLYFYILQTFQEPLFGKYLCSGNISNHLRNKIFLTLTNKGDEEEGLVPLRYFCVKCLFSLPVFRIRDILPDPYLWLTDPDSAPDPSHFVSELQDANKKLLYFKFFRFLLFEGIFTSLFKHKKVMKNSQNSRNNSNKGFSYYFFFYGRRTRIRTFD